MADEYQLRKDIDKIYFRVYDVENDRLLVYTKDEMNALLNTNYFDQSEVLKLIQENGGSFDFQEIEEDDDLNDYNWQGAFYCTSPSYSTISNTPTTQPFVLTVDGDIDVLQTFIDLNNKETYTRICFNSTFSAWKKQATLDDLLEKTYPIGSIYMSVNSTSPSTLFGGTWVQLTDTFLYASNTADTDTTTAKYGEATHTLTIDEMPSHNHRQYYKYRSSSGSSSTFGGTQNSNEVDRYTDYTGGGHPHNNMPPYMKVYMWKRTA